MSGGGPPHQPHNRHVPPANSVWNHLQVPNYFPRQPQLAHMQAEHSLLHQPSWHTPTTTDAMKMLPHTHMLNEMFKNEALFPRDCVDLSLTRNGNQNGELPTTPAAISLSVRDTSKINSLPHNMLDIQAMELTKCVTSNLKSAVSPGAIRSTSMSPGLKSASPGLISSSPGLKSVSPGRKSLSPGPKSSSPGLNMGIGVLATATATVSSSDIGKNQKRSNIRVDSILERLNPMPEKVIPYLEAKQEQPSTTTSTVEKSQMDRPSSQSQSVIVQAASSYDENSNSSGTTNVLTPTNPKEDDSGSLYSNEDSLDSTKSRRKRKPSKTMRVTKEDEIKTEREKIFSEVTSTDQQNHRESAEDSKTPPPILIHSDPAAIATILEGSKLPESRQSSDELDAIIPAKTRRKASSESETIDNIAAMVQEGLKEKEKKTEGGLEVKKEEVVIKSDREEIKSEVEESFQPGNEKSNDEMEITSALSSKEGSEALTKEETTESAQKDTVDGIEKITEDTLLSEQKDTVDGLETKDKDELTEQKDIVEGLEAKKEDSLTSAEKDTCDELDKCDGLESKVEDTLTSVQEDTIDGLETKEEDTTVPSQPTMSTTKPVTVSVIKTKDNLEETLSSSSDVQTATTSTIISEPPPEKPSVPPLITPAQKKASITHFVEVENKLEEMFAGIVEDHVDATTSSAALEPLRNDSTLGLADDSSLLKLDDSVTSTSQEIMATQEVTASPEVTTSQEVESPRETTTASSDVKKEEKKPVVKKARRSRPPSRRDSEQDGETPIKKKRLTKTRGVSLSTTTKKTPRSPIATISKSPKKPSIPVTSNKTPTKPSITDVVKDIYAYDSGSNASSSRSKGPFVQIRGPRDSPLSVSVVNTPLTGDEDGERKPLKSKKFHDDSEYRHKVRSKGLHCSTLSNKYDAERKDTSWICAFCKRGPHASELTGPSLISEVPPAGDLFGPYVITANCPEFEKRLDDPYDRQFKSKKIGKVLDEAALTSYKSGKKGKRKSESIVESGDIWLGVTDTGNNTYEVWAHEDCLVWSSGIYLVGPKIIGLEEAVWTSCNIPCSGCGLKGANISCIKRGCLSTSHLCCARKTHWEFDEASFRAYCPLHSH